MKEEKLKNCESQNSSRGKSTFENSKNSDKLKSSKNSIKSKRKVFYYDELDKKFITKDFIEFLSNNNKICDGNEKYSKVPFESPNTNAFIDIDGDCLNDIIISSYDNQNKKRKWI